MNKTIIISILSLGLLATSVQAYELRSTVKSDFPYELKKSPGYLTSRLNLRLADLVGHKCKFTSNIDYVELHIDVDNDGNADALAFDVDAQVRVTDAAGNLVSGSSLNTTIRYFSLTAGTRARQQLGYVGIPDRMQDYQVNIDVVIDPTSTSQMMGEVWEANESNNAMSCEYTVFAY